MANQQLRGRVQHAALKCSELERHNLDINIEIQDGLDISTIGMSSPFFIYHTKQAIVGLSTTHM